MIIPVNYDRHLLYINAEGKQAAFKIVAFDVDDKGKLTPITYPTPPKGARLYSVEADGFRLFDIGTGTTTGHGLVQPE